LRRAWQVRTLRLRPVCRRLSEQDGSGRQAACHQRCLDDRRSRSPGDICRLRNGGACDPTCAGRGSAGDRPADGAVSVDDLAGVATQCRDAQRGPGLSGNHSAVACGPGRSAPKACEAGDQRGAASVCAGSISRRGRNAAWGCGSRSGGVLERSPTRTSAGSAVGLGVEPGADCPSLTARLPAR